MISKAKGKDFDCLENKWKAAKAIYEETKNMSNQELIEYYRTSVKMSPFAEWWLSVKENNRLHSVN